MPSAEYDLRYLRAGVSLLENYLLSADLYWPVGVHPPKGEPPYPRFTLGSLLFAQKRLYAYSLNAEQQAELASLGEQIDSIRSHWQVAWGQKAAVEFRSRLTLWRNYLEEYREHPEANADRYAYEVGRRVQLQLLSQEAGEIPQAETSLLKSLDKYLQAVFRPGAFIWDEQLKTSFPRDPYWYLYGRPGGD